MTTKLICPICKIEDCGFTIFPNKHKKVIKWDCGHYVDRKTKRVVEKVNK